MYGFLGFTQNIWRVLLHPFYQSNAHTRVKTLLLIGKIMYVALGIYEIFVVLMSLQMFCSTLSSPCLIRMGIHWSTLEHWQMKNSRLQVN